MTRSTILSLPLSLFLLLFLSCLGLLAASAAQGQPPGEAPAFGDEPEFETGDFVGVGSCANGACHGASQPIEDSPIRGDEYTSRVLDPHFRAYDILNSELSQEIAGYLRPGTPATQMDLCLDCHTVNVPASRDRGIERLDGVSCEGCHGAAGGWWDRHYEDGWTHEDSVDAGLRDLRRPAVRADVCMDCHQGNGDQSVDHRLIAAGHPVLTFELDNYASLPELVHWRSDRERERRPSHGLRAWAVGQVVGLREGLELLAERAGGDGPWPEFAELSCTSCHHTVDSGSGTSGDSKWRQREGYVFQDGLPPWSPAKWAVTRHLLDEIAEDSGKDLDPKIAELSRKVRSMADRRGVAELARALAADLDKPLRKADDARWTRDRAQRLMERLADDRMGVLRADEASARQVALALQSLSGFLVETGGLRLGDPRIDAVDALFEELDAVGWDSEAFASRLAAVGG